MIESSISVGNAEELVLLLGTKDQHLRQIRGAIPAKISTREADLGKRLGELQKRRDVVASVEALRLSGRAYTGTIVTESARVPRLRRRRPRARQFNRVVSQVVATATPRAATARTRSARKPPQ